MSFKLFFNKFYCKQFCKLNFKSEFSKKFPYPLICIFMTKISLSRAFLFGHWDENIEKLFKIKSPVF